MTLPVPELARPTAHPSVGDTMAMAVRFWKQVGPPLGSHCQEPIRAASKDVALRSAAGRVEGSWPQASCMLVNTSRVSRASPTDNPNSRRIFILFTPTHYLLDQKAGH